MCHTWSWWRHFSPFLSRDRSCTLWCKQCLVQNLVELQHCQHVQYRTKLRFLVFCLVLVFSCTNTHPNPWSLLEDPKSENGSFSTDSKIDPVLNRPLKYLITPKNARKHKEREKLKKENERDWLILENLRKNIFRAHLLSLAQDHQKCPKILECRWHVL